MKERPICFIEECNNGAMLVLYGKFICGECYMKLYEAEQDKKINEIQKFLKK